jgi:hypothetical protein
MNTVKIIISSFFCLTLIVPAQALQVSYYKIINQQATQLPYRNSSAFAASFDQFATRKEKIEHLLSLCTKDAHDEYTFTITNIPQKQGLPPTSAFISMGFETAGNYKEDLAVYSIPINNPAERILTLNFNGDTTIYMLWFLDKPLAILGEINHFNNISGSTIMKIFDGLCELCTVGKVVLKDISKLPEVQIHNDKFEWGETKIRFNKMNLKVLYPYIYGKTFYERFGFIPTGLTLEQYSEYIDAREYLTHRPLQEIIHDFSDKKNVADALLSGYNELRYFPSHFVPLQQATIRDALYVPYIRIKTLDPHTVDPVTGKSQLYYIKTLSTIYDNCLENYTSTLDPAKTARIKEYQKIISEISIFEKVY